MVTAEWLICVTVIGTLQLTIGYQIVPRYTNPAGEATEEYPFNPNGSADGIAALCSPNGRHLALMPHPERCFLGWQNPYLPEGLGLSRDGPGPWLRLFQNARVWAEKSDK